MLVIDASALMEALLVAGPARERLASTNLQAPELIDAPLLTADARLARAPGLPGYPQLRPTTAAQSARSKLA